MTSYPNPEDRPRQAREDRPNPRWPQDEHIEALVARARATIARDPSALVHARSPVADVVLWLVSAVDADEQVAARVVEGVLADSACRHMLNGVGLHDASRRNRRPRA